MPRKKDPNKKVGRSFKASLEVDEYLKVRGTGIIDPLIRKSKDFREFQKQLTPSQRDKDEKK